MDAKTRSNTDWVRLLQGDGPERDAILAELRQVLLRVLRKTRLRLPYIDESLLEDSVQDALILVLDRLEQFEGRSQFLTWAGSIAIHATMSNIRKQRYRHVSMEDVMEDTDERLGVQCDAAEERDRDTMVEHLNHLINHTLTERQRTVLLAELKGVPQEIIAQWLDSNRNAIYKLAHDARKKLKQGLQAAGYQPSDINVAFNS